MNAPAHELSHGPAAVVAPLRLNLGCGRSALPGWVNVDHVSLPGVDLVQDLNNLNRNATFGMAAWDVKLSENSVDEFLMSHTIEHITNTLPLMQELHRIAKPGATCTIRVPYGSSDDADEDPTHVRRYFLQSWLYFSQPAYWRAQYDTIRHYDVFGQRVHPNRACPWHVLSSSQSSVDSWMGWANQEAEEQQPGQTLRISRLWSDSTGRPVRQPFDAALQGQGPDAVTESQTERAGSVHHESGIRLCDGPIASREETIRAPRSHGKTPGPEAAHLGTGPSQEREALRQPSEKLGNMGAGTAQRSETERASRLDRDAVSKRVTPVALPEIGEHGCVCTTKDYGYRGDWQAETIELVVPASRFDGITHGDAMNAVRWERNVVREMIATLYAVKPIREPKRELQVPPNIKFVVLP